MSDSIERGPSWSRQWRGNHHTWQRAYTREYDFPVTVRRIGEEESKDAHALQHHSGNASL